MSEKDPDKILNEGKASFYEEVGVGLKVLISLVGWSVFILSCVYACKISQTL